jgi:hypothetical protein
MELVQTNVQTIAHFMIAARQALDDAPALQSLIDGELRYGLSLVEEAQLLVGDGSETNLLGLIPQATAYSAAFVVTGETAIDRLALALLQSEQALLPATGIVVYFTDWENADDQGRHGQVYFGGSRRGHPAATLGRSACRHAGNIRRQLPGRLILYRGADIRSDGS